jgi:phosphotransferase system enzyme I (PtsI)
VTLALSGHVVEAGIAVGQAHIIQHNELEIGEFHISEQHVPAEIERLQLALEDARAHLRSLGERLRKSSGAAAEEIIRTHLYILEDASLVGAAVGHIEHKLCNAEGALQVHLEELLAEFRNIDDAYIRSRAEDAVQVVQMVQEYLAEGQGESALEGVPDRLGHTLVIANDLAPGELATLHERGVAGVITEHGSPHSHTAILARSLGIPTVMGVRRAQSLVHEGESLILDGHYGVVFADPEESILEHYVSKQAQSHRFRKSLEDVRQRPATSLDSVPVLLLANAERSEDMRQALLDGAEGVGLYRSEFLFLQGSAPGENEQYEHYRAALDALQGATLTIRTLDLGADKTADHLNFETLRSHPNTALGLRAVHLCLRETDLFKTQLRAIA